MKWRSIFVLRTFQLCVSDNMCWYKLPCIMLGTTILVEVNKISTLYSWKKFITPKYVLQNKTQSSHSYFKSHPTHCKTSFCTFSLQYQQWRKENTSISNCYDILIFRYSRGQVDLYVKGESRKYNFLESEFTSTILSTYHELSNVRFRHRHAIRLNGKWERRETLINWWQEKGESYKSLLRTSP